MTETLADLDERLWDAANELWTNSSLKPSEYAPPILGLIFLKYADSLFVKAQAELEGKGTGRRAIGKADYHARGVLFVPDNARYSHLLKIPEGRDLGKAVADAMRAIERENEELKDILPKNYSGIDNATLVALMRIFETIPADGGDTFGTIYQNFLELFSMEKGEKGGEFFTPPSIVRLIVEVIEPFHGRIYDPACGSGGMFVWSAEFVKRHRKKPANEIMIFGQEKSAENVRICKMNLAIHGLSGDIREGNTYYDDRHESFGKFDFVMANPKFNEKAEVIRTAQLKEDKRFSLGVTEKGKANYLWIQIFWHALNARGRAGFVMANSASDSGMKVDLDVRKKMIQMNAVDVVVSVASNMFYTVTLPCTLWFLDRGKAKTPRKDKVLFLDAREVFHQIDRVHRDYTPDQIEFLANIVRLYRGQEPESVAGSEALMKERFPGGKYRDVPGLCKTATIAEIEEQRWSLNPGVYVGVPDRPVDDGNFKEELGKLKTEFDQLTSEAHGLEGKISANLADILKKTDG